jgi:hypothetical protein
MALFFFDFQEGTSLHRDDVGTELNHEQIEEEVVAALTARAGELFSGSASDAVINVVVRGEDDREILSAQIALHVTRRPRNSQ